MKSPFFWNNFAVLLLVIANFAVSLFCVFAFHRKFKDSPFVLNILGRTFCVLYTSASLIILLVAISLFYSFEVSGYSRECWKARHNWSEIKAGMEQKEVLKIFGAGGQQKRNPTRTGEDPDNSEVSTYCLHPFDYTSQAEISFKINPASGEKKVVEKRPADEDLRIDFEWLPSKDTILYRAYTEMVSRNVIWSAFVGIILLAVLILLPFGFRGDWNSWMLYIPLASCVFGVMYEKAQAPDLQRYDSIIVLPLYALILLGWLIRIIIAIIVKLRESKTEPYT